MKRTAIDPTDGSLQLEFSLAEVVEAAGQTSLGGSRLPPPLGKLVIEAPAAA